MRNNRNTLIPVLCMVATFAAGMAAGKGLYTPDLKQCRTMVITDLKQGQNYAAELAGVVSPDFLTAMTKGK